MRKVLVLAVVLFFALGSVGSVLAQAPAPKPAPKKEEAKKEAVAPKEKIDINTATAKDLEKLPGIGPKTAEKIIKNRPYKKIDDLVAKKVLTQKQFAKIKDQIIVAEAKPAAAAAEAPKKEEKKK
ncbi:MAG: helix-hairpin-helix domain-containing protein [candidate division NC10 bacterium]|nr:helix-hairpin-helix domain-containing protein [candidate division NC10 bacterium]